MALSAIALVSVEEARAVLGIGDSSRDTEIEGVIEKASALAENVYCFRPLKRRAFTNLRVEGHCNPRLGPEAWPINVAGTISVTVNDVAQTLWKGEGDGPQSSKDVMVYEEFFERPAGWSPTGGSSRNVVLTFEGGYDPVPEDLKAAVLELIQKLWGPFIEQRPDFASMAGPGGSVQSLDGQWGGPSAGWALSRRSKEVFNTYRRLEAA